jgi:adenine-specific DNA-methyltransferase
MDLSRFNRMAFLPALKALFKDLHVPVNFLTDEPTSARTILKDTWKDNAAFQLMKDVYFLGIVDDAAFAENKSIDASTILSDYDGVLIFGVTLIERENNRLPTRSQLAEIARAFNREYFYTPVNVVFQYNGYLAFANTERLKYKQEWREGEKAGKVSLLRDIDITNPHAGHVRIINDLKIPDGGKNKVDSFATLYAYWQDVFSVSILNKKFYQELSNWYFWAVKEVSFPSEPAAADEHLKNIDLAALRQEHNAKNVIRLLTRFLFVWFVKEKKLIPEELFDIDYLKNELLKDLSPVRNEGLFKEANIESVYYKAILQNLFFASLNCPIIPSENGDNRKRGFRLKDNYGQHRDANFLMRYQNQFINPKKFIELINGSVPFLNGGLFECLDNKTDKIYIDGFSDNLVKPHQLVVPDYLFFGFDREVDLSRVVGISTKAFRNAKVKGLIPILESYKFTIAENTPIEEDVALDPELLGKVFENLLASYNPETKTTARKQTGSFYTPREIVNYMVDESLVAYLKNSVKNWDIEAEELDKQLHDLLSYDAVNPFAGNNDLQKQIIHALDNCKILDPACGSGAFPMGILQKMVHILQKVDPENKSWQELQKNKALKETEGAFAITDKKERKEKLDEINEAFDENINDPDYARKLFLVENCIYGVDIQEVAAQISKLRFFISLVVDQKVDKAKPNFGIRALPNLETKFVAANTLIGIEKPKDQMHLFDNQAIKELELELKTVRHRLFSAKYPVTKRTLRNKDKEIREKIGDLLIEHGWGNKTAKQLAGWDPYDQNTSSPFFDSEWMFDILDGFDVVIGNPPYLKERDNAHFFESVNQSEFGEKWHQGKMDFWFYFLHKAIDLSQSEICFITSRYWLNSQGSKKLINRVKDELFFVNVIDIGKLKVFDAVAGHHMVSHFSKKVQHNFKYTKLSNDLSGLEQSTSNDNAKNFTLKNSDVFKENDEIVFSKDMFSELCGIKILGELFDSSIGVQESVDKISKKQFQNSSKNNIYAGKGVFVLTQKEVNGLSLNLKEISVLKPYVDPNDVSKYHTNYKNLKYLIYSDKIVKEKIRSNRELNKIKKHIDSLAEFITSSNKPYGIHRPRKAKFFENPKIVFKNMFLNPDFAYDEKKIYFGFSFSSIIQKNNYYSLKYLLTLLNSVFARKWFYTFGKQRGVGVDIGVEKLRLFPVKIATPESQQIFVQLADIAIKAKLFSGLKFNTVCAIIDALIFQLYFPDHMQDRKIDILKIVEKDLEEVIQGREFDPLTNDQKEKMIGQLHARWTDPESEIVKRMNSFAEKSPDILKPILESR